MELTEKSHRILESIAEGHSFEQILSANRELTYHAIFQAAAEALECLEHPEPGKAYSVDEIRKKSPRAYEKWSIEEDAELAELHRSGMITKDIATRFQRQPSAIRSRVLKLDLVKPT
jgi:hypothetical protein